MILEAIFQAGAQVIQPIMLVALVVGCITGVAIGAIPGLGPAVGIAILLPYTFGMEPLSAITLLMGIYAGGWYGGAIPAILINTPGTAVNVLTTYDGFPMTQRGEAQRALSLAYVSSFFGGTLSVLALILVAPFLAAFSARFGAPDLAMAALLAMVLVVTTSRGGKLAATAMLGGGLFLGTIGIEGAFGSPRFNFGQTWLLGGVSLVSVILGLFALSQAFVLISQSDARPAENRDLNRNLFSGFSEVFKYPRTLFSSAGFGIVMGVLPGVGEFLAQFFSYSLARKRSKAPEAFGNGAPEGIIASEAANNAVPAAALVPLLALGIPGESLTAMMLVVFTVHNVDPGPSLFVENVDFVRGLYLSLFLMNFVIIAILLFATRWIALVARIDPRLLGVCIFCLVMVGTYTVNYRLSDPLISVVFGILGYALHRSKIPTIPIVLGLILGPIVEKRARQSIGSAGGDLMVFIERPISAILLATILILIIASVVRAARSKKHREQHV